MPFQYVSPRPLRGVTRGPHGFVAVGDGGEIRLRTMVSEATPEVRSPAIGLERSYLGRYIIATKSSSGYGIAVETSTTLNDWEPVAAPGSWYVDDLRIVVRPGRDRGFYRVVQLPVSANPSFDTLALKPAAREWNVIQARGQSVSVTITNPSPSSHLVSTNGGLWLGMGDLPLTEFCAADYGMRLCKGPITSPTATLLDSVLMGDAKCGTQLILWKPDMSSTLVEYRNAVWSDRPYAQHNPDTGTSELTGSFAFTGLYLHDLAGAAQSFASGVTVSITPAGGNVVTARSRVVRHSRRGSRAVAWN